MKKVLIIGGSRGIGREVLIQQSQKNDCVNYSRTEPEIPYSFEHVGLDIVKDEIPKLDTLDALIYCPGTINLKPINSLKEEDFINDFNVNILGAVRAIKANLRALKKSNLGSIVLFSTVAVSKGMAFHASIATAKAGLEGLTRSLAAELAPKVRVNCIAPGITNTPLASHILRNDALIEKTREMHPLKKICQPSDIAHMVDFLVSDASSAITGQVFHVDNGMSSIK